MTFTKEYNGSYIFSEVITSLNKKNNIEHSFIPSIDFLSKKDSVFNGLNDIDFYCLIDIQNNGSLIFEKNLSLDLGLEEHSLIHIMSLIPTSSIRLDAEMDKIFIEFCMKHKFTPMDVVMTNEHVIKDYNGNTIILQRNITILANDSNEIPAFGFCGIRLLKKSSTTITENNYNLSFTKEKERYREELVNIISQAITKIV